MNSEEDEFRRIEREALRRAAQDDDDDTQVYTSDAIAFVAEWKAAQRQWQGLTEQDMPSGEDPMFDHLYFIAGMVYADKVLKKKNT